MKKGILTIIFMVLITIVFISALASIHELSKERVMQNAKIDQYKSILYAFDIFPENINELDLGLTSTTDAIPWQQDQILQSIERQIRTIKIPVTEAQVQLLNNSFLTVKDSTEIFVRLDETGEILAYGFPMRGKGLWGTITAFGVISADLTKMIGIDFTEQVETPGLGARITEIEFKYFFRNLDLSGFQDAQSNQQPVILLKKKEQTNREKSTNSFQAITGATQTVDGVLKMVSTDLRFYINLIKQNEDLIGQEVG
ncbi:MAG: FMN-binding protein [bacterium]|jgi:Na+-transporting NADH:ubiquinone oxidoreductase subunit C|nr:FMN-binding protein [bacterium]